MITKGDVFSVRHADGLDLISYSKIVGASNTHINVAWIFRIVWIITAYLSIIVFENMKFHITFCIEQIVTLNLRNSSAFDSLETMSTNMFSLITLDI